MSRRVALVRTSVLTRATRRDIPEDGILHNHIPCGREQQSTEKLAFRCKFYVYVLLEKQAERSARSKQKRKQQHRTLNPHIKQAERSARSKQKRKQQHRTLNPHIKHRLYIRNIMRPYRKKTNTLQNYTTYKISKDNLQMNNTNKVKYVKY
jgi:hypothetical protein